MAVTINADNGAVSGSAGLKQSADSTGVLALQTNGTTAVTVSTSQNVGIGTASPSSPLNVVAAAASGLAIAINGRSSDNTGAMYFYANNGSTQYATITTSATEFRLSSVPAASVQTFYTNGSERMRLDASGNVGIGTSSPASRLNIATGASTSCTFTLTANNTGTGAGDRGRLDFYSADNSGVAYQLGYMDYDRSDGTGTASYIAWANRKAGTVSESMRIDSSGNVGVNSTSPAQYATSGKVLNITGTANNSGPAVQVMSGSSANPGAGNYIREVFAIASISNTATEITRITGTGANGMSMYIRVTASGHTSGVGNGSNYKAVRYDGGTAAVTQVETATSGSVPPITFDTATSNILIIKLASSTASQIVNGVMVVEWFVPIDFASNTWVVS